MSRIAQGVAKVTPLQLVKTVAASGTPEAVSSTSIRFRSATFLGAKAYQTNNTGTVRLGWSSTNGEQWIPVPSGESVTIEADDGEAFDLAEIYVDVATNGDGVVVGYS